MTDLPVPADAITDLADVVVGREVWQVFGIWPPFVSGPTRITRAPSLFRDHPEYRDIHACTADAVVFDLDDQMNFAADCNLAEHSHNDNYLLPSEAAAHRARDLLTAAYRARPELIERERRRYAMTRECAGEIDRGW